jgi:hypothetical protein
MKGAGAHGYHADMAATTWRRGLAGLLSVFVFLVGFGSRAQAMTSYVPTTPAPFIVVQLGSGSVTVRTWDRPGIQIDGDPSITYNHAPPRQVASRIPPQIMLWSQTIQTPSGPLSLPPEPFPLPPFAPGEHDALVVRGDGDVTITIPEQSPLVLANVRLGSLTVDDFHSTALVAHVNAGEVHLNDVSGTAAIQVNNGPFFATGSSFDRLRLRTGRGNIYMSDCRVSQIQVTSLTGSILFDDGVFEPGLARFESTRGAVAIGLASGAQIEAHSGAGRILYEAGPEGGIARGANDAQAALLGGGPVVTASSTGGAVIFYRGLLHDHPRLERAMPPRLRQATPPRAQPFPPPRRPRD